MTSPAVDNSNPDHVTVKDVQATQVNKVLTWSDQPVTGASSGSTVNVPEQFVLRYCAVSGSATV